MLFILTGDIQIGKTRWLSRLIEHLTNNGVLTWGVLAPGVWRCLERSEGIMREKIGIDNVLLPQKERISFARRRDLQEESFCLTSQSDAAQLAWAIDDDAIAHVNHYFDSLANREPSPEQLEMVVRSGGRVSLPSGEPDRKLPPGLLVVDELGRLELQYARGLSSAVALIENGPCELYPHALVVVRNCLCETACEQFAHSWSKISVIAPDNESFERVLSLFAP